MSKTTENTEKKETNNGIKNFKASSDVENFYRFIFDNGLRSEAHQLMELVLKRITPQKKRGRKKATTLQ